MRGGEMRFEEKGGGDVIVLEKSDSCIIRTGKFMREQEGGRRKECSEVRREGKDGQTASRLW